MIHPATKVTFIDAVKGNGVVATAPIPRGTITWVFDDLDREIPMAALEAMSEPCREAVLTYSYRNRHGNLIFCWDHERYINHSFFPNCILTPYGFEVASADIAAGEELTNDYGMFNIILPFPVDSQGGERTVVYPDDLLHYGKGWDEVLRKVFPSLLRVPQPLRPLLSDEGWQQIESLARGETAIASLRECYYNDHR
jgi:uncharacterized protein